MKILFVLGRYLPAKSGGIENYTHWLATLLLRRNYNVEVAILDFGEQPYVFEGVQVTPLVGKLEGFIALLKKRNYDICHFQEFSDNGIDVAWFRIANEYCKKVFFTFHLPYLTCYKNDFRYFGVEDCNNFTNPARCVSCIVATKFNYKKTDGLSLYNLAIKSIIPFVKKTNKIAGIRNNIERRKNNLQELIHVCDTIFIYGAWFKKLLIENGYESSKLKMIPHISKPDIKIKDRENVVKRKFLFVGRIEKAKGLHLLAEAMNSIEIENIQLDVAGNRVDEKYFDECKKTFSFNYIGVVPRNELLRSFPDYDFLVLPSVFTEMYSLALKEAYYEQLPVIVSAAKGNKDVVTEGKNGFIFDYDNADDLAKKIDTAYQLLESGWKPVFSKVEEATDVENEILSYYQ